MFFETMLDPSAVGFGEVLGFREAGNMVLALPKPYKLSACGKLFIIATYEGLRGWTKVQGELMKPSVPINGGIEIWRRAPILL